MISPFHNPLETQHSPEIARHVKNITLAAASIPTTTLHAKEIPGEKPGGRSIKLKILALEDFAPL
jgi:hypothetical protein